MIAHKPEVLAIIPARGGSKSIPRKNIKHLNGHPLIAYSIISALYSQSVGRVIVSTDDQEIAGIARQWGAEVPFLRPATLAGDLVTDLPVFQHALNWLAQHEGYQPEWVIQLRCTSPLRPLNCIDNAMKLALKLQPDCIRSVTPSGQNPYKMWKLEGASMQPLIKSDIHEAYNMPRQELPPTYWQTGHVEVIRSHTILQKNSMTGDVILPFLVDSQLAVDLDTNEQWLFAEHVLRSYHGAIVRPAALSSYQQNSRQQIESQ